MVAHGFFPPEVRAQVTALACSSPEQAGIPIARWSCAELAVALVMLGVVVQIAGSTVWRWLQAERLKPWRYHLWQHVRDPHFLERAKAVLQLFAALSVADGQVYGCCRSRKCCADFQAFFVEVIVPEAIRRGVKQIRLILDHGPTHAPKQLEGWLAQQQLEQAWPFTVQVVWLPKYASWLDQIEIWFSILPRKALTPNHFASLEALKQRIMEFIAHYNQLAQPIQWSYTVAKLEKKFVTN